MEVQIAVFGILRFPSENITKILPHLKKLIFDTYENDGCIAFDVAKDRLEAGLLRFSVLWPNKESLAKHLSAVHIEPWRMKAKEHGILERKFTFYEVKNSELV